MNKIKKILIAVFGGVERTFYVFSPMLLGTLWLSISNINGASSLLSIFIFILSGLSTVFRGIKLGGWLDVRRTNRTRR